MSEFKICDEILRQYYNEYLETYIDKSKSNFYCNMCCKFLKYSPTIFKSHFFSKKHQKYLIEMEEIKNDFKSAVLIEL
jgi:hypothetical protein